MRRRLFDQDQPEGQVTQIADLRKWVTQWGDQKDGFLPAWEREWVLDIFRQAPPSEIVALLEQMDLGKEEIQPRFREFLEEVLWCALERLRITQDQYREYCDQSGIHVDYQLAAAVGLLRGIAISEIESPGSALFFRKNFGTQLLGMSQSEARLLSVMFENLERKNGRQIREAAPTDAKELIRTYFVEAFEELQITEKQQDELLRVWVACAKPKRMLLIALRCLEVMRGLEFSLAARDFREPSGAILQYFLVQRGIRVFARYTQEELLEQYKERNTPGDYALMSSPYTDWNEVFSSADTQAVFSTLRGQCKQLGIPLRSCEAGDSRGLLRRVIQISQDVNGYFDKNSQDSDLSKMVFWLFNAHGEIDNVHLGNETDSEDRFKNRIALTDLLNVTKETFSRLYRSGISIVLNSCKTGEPDGLAQTASYIVDGEVIGPRFKTALRKLTLARRGRRIIAEAVYGVPNKGVYRLGDSEGLPSSIS